MRMLMASAALSTGILVFGAGGIAEAADFNEASLQGPYSFSLNGTITFLNGKQLFLPTWTAGVIRGDGAGHIVGIEAVVNVGGCLILKQAGTTGTYSVNSDGTGHAEAQLTSEPLGAPNAQCPSLGQGLFPENVQLTFDFAINSEGVDVVATSYEGPNGPIAAYGSSGQATLQVRPSPTRATPK